jgi:RHS repeat-associated protein
VHDTTGNLNQFVNTSDGSLKARYGRDPYGSVLTASGNCASDSPFGFSTKYEDRETALVYYGFRYLAPGTGRWLSRDPVGERGGPNAYTFVLNLPASWVDSLGLKGKCTVTIWIGTALRTEG